VDLIAQTERHEQHVHLAYVKHSQAHPPVIVPREQGEEKHTVVD